MALIHSDIWGGGKHEQLGLGWHYKKKCQSIVVPSGQVVTIYENEDRTGRKTLPLYEGSYLNLVFYGVSRSAIIVVEKTELDIMDLVEIGWDHRYDNKGSTHPMHYMVPIGDKIGGRDFPEDKIQWCRIPFGVTVEAFIDNNFKGGSLMMSGNVEGERELWHLSHFESKTTKYKKFSWNVSSMKIRADKWESAGVELRNVEIEGSESNKFAGVTEIANNSPFEGFTSKEISWEKGISQEENWNIGGRVCAKAGFEAETMGIKVTGEMEVEVSGGYGEAKSKSDSKTITDTVGVNLPGGGIAKVSTTIEYGKMTADAIRKWKNMRNGAIIEEKGKIICSWANDASHEINGRALEPVSRMEE